MNGHANDFQREYLAMILLRRRSKFWILTCQRLNHKKNINLKKFRKKTKVGYCRPSKVD
jgi:hypothetical protein